MELYLVRHATATDQVGGDVEKDAERPLIDEGKEEARAMAWALRKMGIKGHVFLCSPFLRAKQTAQIFAEILGYEEKLQLCDTLGPGCDPNDLYELLAKVKGGEEVFIFGHMPDLSRLAGALLGNEDIDVAFKKASVCRIDIFDVPPTEPGALKWLLTPKMAKSLQH